MGSPKTSTTSLTLRTASFIAFAVVLFLLGAYALTPAVVRSWSGEAEMEGRGQFGDQFGAFNAFVSMLTVVAVLGSIWLQRIQHREEMRAAREQHEAQMTDAARKHEEQIREANRVRELDRLFRLLDRRVKGESDVRWTKADGNVLAGQEAISWVETWMYFALVAADPFEVQLVKDLQPIVYRKADVQSAPPQTHEEFRNRYRFLFGIAKFRLAEYLRVITSITKTAARARRSGDEALVETSLQWLTMTDLELLEMHSLLDNDLAKDLRDLKWTGGLYDRMKWAYPRD